MTQLQLEWKKWSLLRPFSMALTSPDGNFNWKEVSGLVKQKVNKLAFLGVSHGDSIALVGKNELDLVIAYLACLELGIKCAIIAPQPYSLLRSKLEGLTVKGHTLFLWLSPCAKAQLSSSDVEQLHADGKPISWDITSSKPSNAIHVSQHNASQHITSQTGIASILFTSGSTGVAKAVAHNLKQHRASAYGLLEKIPFSLGDVWLLSLPMYHVSGLSIIHRWLVSGACIKIGRGDLIQDIDNVTHASLVATQLQRLLRSKKVLKLHTVLLGGSAIPSTLYQAAEQRNIQTWVGYGMTEAASTISVKRVNDVDSVGHVLPNRRLRIDNKKIYLSGDTLACGYYYQGHLAPIVDQRGWFDTRDLGEWVGEELRILGREDNLFISGGENIHCEEIESVLNQHPEVQLSIVIPIDDSEYGAAPMALISGREDISGMSLDSWLDGKLERFKRPKYYHLLPEKLLNTGMKLSRKKVKEYVANNFTNYRVI